MIAPIKLCALVFLTALSGHTLSQVNIEGGQLDCGQWVAARKVNGAAARYEHFVLGALNGMSMASNAEFWRARDTQISRESAWLWIDNYCQANPLNMVFQGAYQLFRDRSGWAPRPSPKP